MNKNFSIRIWDPRPLIWWNSKRSSIDMEPPYQRQGRLWSPTDKAYLIDTILNGYDVPKIYVADYTWGSSPLNKKNLPYAIIDGKQRFEAIFDFFDGNIVLNEDFVFLNNPSLKIAGLGYKDLLKYSDVIDELHNYPLTVMQVYTNDEKTISELFLRLNRSKPLTGAEIRNAMTGHAVTLIREIAKQDFFTENVRFEIKRAQHQNVAAKLLLFEYSKGFKDTTKPSLDKFAMSFKDKHDDQLELAGRKVFDNIDVLSTIFLPKDRLLTSAGILPVYYWLVRDLETKYYSKFREFINAFERNRRTNKQLIREHPESNRIKSNLIEYDNYNRSTNNEQSHKERYRILKDCFKSYLEIGSF